MNYFYSVFFVCVGVLSCILQKQNQKMSLYLKEKLLSNVFIQFIFLTFSRPQGFSDNNERWVLSTISPHFLQHTATEASMCKEIE